jgi:hypothetical protein
MSDKPPIPGPLEHQRAALQIAIGAIGAVAAAISLGALAACVLL